MAKKVIRYLLEGNGSVPLFVCDGGYFPLNEEMVGVSHDEDKRHVPASVVRMTRVELLDHVKLAHKDELGQYRTKPEFLGGGQFSDAEMEDMMEAWLASVGQEDLA